MRDRKYDRDDSRERRDKRNTHIRSKLAREASQKYGRGGHHADRRRQSGKNSHKNQLSRE